jgi:phosphatidylglycerol---prolipoprotein diacylglyceryl transferase
VQLYESLAMLSFLGVFLAGLRVRSPLVSRYGFYLFIAWYAIQRFAWEFLKPYPRLVGPLNLFHLACLALLIYSAFMMRRNHELIARA